MKKIVALLLAVLMLFSASVMFTSCGEKADNTLDMATNAAFPPYEYKDGETFKGIDVEIAGLIAEKLGMELKIHDVEFGSIIAGVQSNKFDMGMAGMTVNPERQEKVNFSETYANGVQVVIVKEDSEYASFEDFYTEIKDDTPQGVKEGIKIGVQQDTTGDIYASDDPENWGFGSDNVIRYKTGADAVQALISGKVTAVIIDNEPAKAFVEGNKGLKIMDLEYAVEDYAIAIAKTNTELLDKINNALDELEKEGKIAEIIEKYIPSK
ncbi:MAG: amino acid ABC transporter substrate-binding protein [Clostridia bacterium]|nr:amino acid ABC transporter substrate-binding protein [Clostridia bacterium]